MTSVSEFKSKQKSDPKSSFTPALGGLIRPDAFVPLI